MSTVTKKPRHSGHLSVSLSSPEYRGRVPGSSAGQIVCRFVARLFSARHLLCEFLPQSVSWALTRGGGGRGRGSARNCRNVLFCTNALFLDNSIEAPMWLEGRWLGAGPARSQTPLHAAARRSQTSKGLGRAADQAPAVDLSTPLDARASALCVPRLVTLVDLKN